MAMADLARLGSGRPVALAEIATRQGISLSYLEQLFAKLRRHALVTAMRGPGGGYLLARMPEAIRVSDILVAVDEPIQMTPAEDDEIPAAAIDSCLRGATYDLWEELGQHIRSFLDNVSLRDVLNRGDLVAPRVVANEGDPAPERQALAG